ncbi:MAG: cyclase [Actinobacteria bacterium]|nr:cyclase [Actinomycetota bacterium]
MLIVTITHPVEDYTWWRAGFDGFEGARRASGTKFERVPQDVNDPNLISVVMGFDTREQADAFLGLPELKEAMAGAGVTAPPEFRFMNEVGRFDY